MPQKGEKAFAKCKACHVADAETNRVGPHLKGVIGRNVASVENYKYSEAMLEFAKANPVWTEELFLKYIENPKAMVPKTKMVYPGSKKEEERADLLAYPQDQDVTREKPLRAVARTGKTPAS